MEKNNWWKISLVLSLIQMVLFGYLDFILANTGWFFSFGFIVLLFIGLLLYSVILIALKKKIGYLLGLFFSLLGIMFGFITILVSYLMGQLDLITSSTPVFISFAVGVEPIVFLLFIVIPIAFIYAISKAYFS